ncbi:12623_t:CDS:2 [Funneliformis caledonium]|uniref:12623_t:CDS:1 n=1 Tax=Funneliformis caledonium TaxID=1117310 RepID=A0A9N9CVU1_9GLOM|nr:12623_t:CDS:2 [Funneliformis caledonium]
MNQISMQDKLTETNLQKRKEQDKKVFRLFNVVDFFIARLNE